MKILVSVASRHGATGEIGEVIAGVLRDAGLAVQTRPPSDVTSLDDFDAVVLGSAVYAGRWMEEARRFAQRHHEQLRGRPVWLFSSGPIGVPLAPAEESADALQLVGELTARARERHVQVMTEESAHAALDQLAASPRTATTAR